MPIGYIKQFCPRGNDCRGKTRLHRDCPHLHAPKTAKECEKGLDCNEHQCLKKHPEGYWRICHRPTKCKIESCCWRHEWDEIDIKRNYPEEKIPNILVMEGIPGPEFKAELPKSVDGGEGMPEEEPEPGSPRYNSENPSPIPMIRGEGIPEEVEPGSPGLLNNPW